MLSKTLDIEQAITAVLAHGDLTVDQIAGTPAVWALYADRREFGASLNRLERDGAIRFPGCPDGHMHEAGCVAEVAR